MKKVVKFIGFIVYLIAIFYIRHVTILLALLAVNFVLTKVLKIKVNILIKGIKILLPFLIFTGGINALLDSARVGILIAMRLCLAYQVTFIFSQLITTLELADTIQNLFCPLKIFHINTGNIGIIVSISLCMLPILRSEIIQKVQALKAKGSSLKPSTIVLIMQPLLISILRRSNEMEKVLKAKAYEE